MAANRPSPYRPADLEGITSRSRPPTKSGPCGTRRPRRLTCGSRGRPAARRGQAGPRRRAAAAGGWHSHRPDVRYPGLASRGRSSTGRALPLQGRGEVVEPFDLLGAELDGVGGGVLLDAGHPLGAGDRGDVVALGEQPGKGGLCRGGISSGRISASTSRVHREYSVCTAVTGWTACARRIVAGLALGQADVADLALAISSASAPTVSSMGVFGSTRCW